MRSFEALKSIAQAIKDDTVFGSWMIPEDDEHLIEFVFLPVKLCGVSIIPPDAAQMFNYTRRATKKFVEGKYPLFMSVRFLTQDEVDVIYKLLGGSNG